MILIEHCPPFQWKPSLKVFEQPGILRWRFMWGFLAVAWTPYDFNAYIHEVSQASISLYKDGELEHEEV